MTAEAKRELIIEAALQIFSQRPYSKVSMMEIAEASKITRANLNYHFGTKRDLYVEVVRLFARLPPPAAAPSAARLESARERLR